LQLEQVNQEMVTRNYTGSSKTNLTNLLTKNNEPDTDFIRLIKKLEYWRWNLTKNRTRFLPLIMIKIAGWDHEQYLTKFNPTQNDFNNQFNYDQEKLTFVTTFQYASEHFIKNNKDDKKAFTSTMKHWSQPSRPPWSTKSNCYPKKTQTSKSAEVHASKT